MSDIKVSVSCTVYNHEKYLRKCLDSLVCQKTNFKYEVIVHDDASTDGSPEIIREYAERYPDLIRPILQTENQFSQNIPFFKKYMLPIMSGRYLATCEGDDFWCDENKLQLQYDAMEAHPECHLCVHKVRCVDETGVALDSTYPSFSLNEGILSQQRFLKIIGKTYSFQTSSYFRRMEDIRKYVNNPPEYKKVADVGDAPWLLYCGTLGDVYYIDREMSCYRKMSIGSWSSRQASDRQKRLAHRRLMVRMYEEFNKETENKFSELVHPLMRGNYLLACELEQSKESCRILLRKENRDYLMKHNKKNIAFIVLRAYAPWVADLYYRLKGK